MDRVALCLGLALGLSLAAWPAVYELGKANASAVLRLDGGVAEDESGTSVAAAGDVNGDGLGDFLVGSPHFVAGSLPGTAYLLLGGGVWLQTAAAAGGSLDLGATCSPELGVVCLSSLAASSGCGYALSGAGDVNGDALDDVLIGEWNTGRAYLLFGRARWTAGKVDLSALTGADGVVLLGPEDKRFGFGLGAAGDVNDDGIGDFLVANQDVERYLVFGHKGAWASHMNLSVALDGATGVLFTSNHDGCAGAGLGDVNGDGIDDFALSAAIERYDLELTAGGAYVVFGHKGAWPATYTLSGITAETGIKIAGDYPWEDCGWAIVAGDLNRDGLPDIAVGCPDYVSSSAGYKGRTAVVFGRAGGWGTSGDPIIISSLPASGLGALFVGAQGDDSSGSLAFWDANADGATDLVIAAPWYKPTSQLVGVVYVVYASKATWPSVPVELSSLDGRSGFWFVGEGEDTETGSAVAAVADLNGDAMQDLVIGADATTTRGRHMAGRTYVVLAH